MLPGTFDVNVGGSCMTAARIIAGKLLQAGCTDVQVVEGWVQFQDEDGSEPEDMRFAHTWVVSGDEVVDPTLEQFKDYLDYYGYRREELEVVAAADYLADTRLNTPNPEIFFKDGVIPADLLQHLPPQSKKSSGLSLGR